MSALSAIALTGCSSGEKDPRAYSGSPAGETLEKVLKSFEIELPSCKTEKIGFSGSSEGGQESLSLSFQAPRPCLDQFLEKYRIDVKHPSHWPFGAWANSQDGHKVSPTEPPFFESDMKRFGWKLDPSTPYDFFGDLTSPNGARFKVLVDRRGAPQTIYMQSVSAPQ